MFIFTKPKYVQKGDVDEESVTLYLIRVNVFV